MTTSFSISFQKPSESESKWLTLEQKDKYYSFVTLDTVEKMIMSVESGVWSYTAYSDDCPVTELEDGSLQIPIPFYIYPSSMTLAYDVYSAWEISEPSIVTLEKIRNLVIEMEDSVELPWVIDSFSYEWQTDVYNENGNVISAPTITLDGNKLRFSETCFGVLRITANVTAREYVMVMTFPEIDPDFEVSDINTQLIAKYDVDGEAQYEEISVILPDCAVSMLSRCDDGTTASSSKTVIYYSSCTGEIIS